MAHPVDQLIAAPPFLEGKDADRLFLDAMDEAISTHCRGNQLFRKLIDRASAERHDLTSLPYLFVGIFKERELITGDRKDIALELTSSGTGGQKSRIFLDAISLQRVSLIARKVYHALGMVDEDERVNYLCFTYDPAVAHDLGTAWTDKLMTGFTKAADICYAIRWKRFRGAFELDEDMAWDALKRFAASALPLRILGFPAMIFDVIVKRAEEDGVRFDFGCRSFVMTGGGWKGKADREIPKPEFRKRAAAALGIPQQNVRDLFGMVEHGIPYVDCEHGHMHVPNYSRVIIRDPATLEPVPLGSTGIMQLVTPYITSYPSVSILTSDFAHVGKSCPCGRAGSTLHMAGRAGVTKHEGCALRALELM